MMWFQDQSDRKLQNLLKQSRQDFRFDQINGKDRLLTTIRINQAIDTVKQHAPHRGLWLRLSVMTACLLLAVTTTFAFAASARPGDKLFSLNKWGEQAILSLPLSDDSKAEVQASIVERRVEALDNLGETSQEIIELETIKESEESLNTAIERVKVSREISETKGNKQSVKHLDDVLGQLANLATKQELKVEAIQKKTSNKQTKAQIQLHLDQIKKAKIKARFQSRQDTEEVKGNNLDRDHENNQRPGD